MKEHNTDESKLSNLRAQYLLKYGHEFQLDDTALRIVIEEIGPLATGEETDQAILEDMHYVDIEVT